MGSYYKKITQSFAAKRYVSLLTAAALFVCLGCAVKSMPKESMDILYSAKQDIDNKNFKDARKKLGYIEESSQDGELLRKTQLLMAQTYLREERWGEAIVKYQQFIDIHPTHHNTDKAQFLIAKCYLKKLENRKEFIFFKSSVIDRELKDVYEAIEEFKKFFRLYPYSKYVSQAKVLYLRCKEILAEKEYYVGMFYFNVEDYAAATGRLRKIIIEYPNISKTRKHAYFYLGEAYWKWGRKEESIEIFKHMLTEYPRGKFSNIATKRIKKYIE